MAYCFYCGKTTVVGRNVSHSNRRTPRLFKANIKRVRARIDGEIKRVKVCTSCIKLGRHLVP